jgi:hypothetical protein
MVISRKALYIVQRFSNCFVCEPTARYQVAMILWIKECLRALYK